MTRPGRIVSLISSATETLYLLGLGERVVGVSHECDYPADVANKPRLTRSLVDSSASSLAIDGQVRSLSGEQAALSPELIITQAQCDVCAVRYEDVVSVVRGTPALKHARVVALNPRSIDDVLADIGRVGEAAGESQKARAAIAALCERIAAVRAKTANLPSAQKPRVACLEWIDPPMLAANWTPELVEIAGGSSGLTAHGQHSAYADWQSVVRYDPQVIVVMPCGFDLERAIVESRDLPRREGWNDLSAVRERRVWAVDGNAYFNRSGPRLVESLEILAHLVHPALFSAPMPPHGQAWRRLETHGRQLVGA